MFFFGSIKEIPDAGRVRFWKFFCWNNIFSVAPHICFEGFWVFWWGGWPLVPSPRPPDMLKSGVDEGRSCVFFFFCGVFVLPLVVSKIFLFSILPGEMTQIWRKYYWNELKPPISCGLWCHRWSNVFLGYGDRVERIFEKADQSTRKIRIDNTNQNLPSTVNGTISASQHIFSSVFLRLFEGWGK